MARTGRGGRRTPNNPAPVSGPGALSRRTDGGPGQPIRVASGGEYGERQALEQQQQAAPLAVAGSSGGGGAPARPAAPVDVFGPSGRPDEPITQGSAPSRGSQAPANVSTQLFLKAMYRMMPTPELRRLMRDPSQ